jgi:hypothetical protein
MKASANWLKIMALGLSLPGTIFFMAWGTMKIVEMGYISKPVGFGIFLAVVVNSLGMIVYYALNKKN